MTTLQKVDLLIDQWKRMSGGIHPTSIYLTSNQNDEIFREFKMWSHVYDPSSSDGYSYYKGIKIVVSIYGGDHVSVGDGRQFITTA